MTASKKKSLSTTSASAILAALWLTCFIFSFSIPCLLSFRKAIESDTLTSSLDQLSGVYAPYIGAILAYYSVSRAPRFARRVTSTTSFTIAGVVSAVWNIIVVGMLAQALFGYESIDDSLKVVTQVSSKLSWLVAPVIGYFFAKSEGSARS